MSDPAKHETTCVAVNPTANLISNMIKVPVTAEEVEASTFEVSSVELGLLCAANDSGSATE